MIPLINPALLQVLAARFSERATLLQETQTRSMTGQRRSMGRQPVADLEKLPCEVVPITTRIGGSEIDAGTRDDMSAPLTSSTRQIAFAGCPAITTEMTLQVLGSGPNSGLYDIDRIVPDGIGLHLIVEATKVEPPKNA